MSGVLDQPQVNLSDVIATHARHRGAKAAVVCGDVTRNWANFDANISRIAHGLIAGGAVKGDRVAIVMENAVEMLEVVFGVIRAGCCAVPLSGMLTTDQLVQLIDDSQAKGVFASAAFGPALSARMRELPTVQAGLCVAHGFESDWTPLDAFMRGQPDTRPAVSILAGDDFNIIYSSGTTGLPKGIVQTHAARSHFAFSNAVEMGFTSASRALTTTPLYSNGTWLMMLPCLFSGGTLHVMPAFDVGGFLDTVRDAQITHTFMVPAQYIMILGDTRLEQADLSSLQTVLSAGSPLRADTKRGVLERISPALIELYGFSEGFASMLKPHEHAEKFNTVGTPVLGFEVAIIDEQGNRCAPDMAGEIVAYGAGMLREYNRRPDLTEELIWRDEMGRSFIRSGDIGALDADGYLKILDRKKDMIVSGGFNVFPADIEAVVGTHEDVSDVTVVGIPHEKWGETCLALVIVKSGAWPDLKEMRGWCNGQLAKHQRLHAIEVREEFPRNALGKVIKRSLREPYWAAESGSQG